MLELLAIIFAIWAVVLLVVKKKGEKYGLELAGPLIMWKTEKGKKFIDNVAKKKLWKFYGNFSIFICIIAMLFTTAIIIWNLIIAFKIPPQNAPSPRLILGIPGINPVIPIGYGILALAIAIVVHEISHGILARYGKIKVKSLGLLFLIVPIGAFVEPDEEQIKKTTRKIRSRIFSAGPASNIVLAVVCILILSFILAPSIDAKYDGMVITYDAYGLNQWDVISKINGIEFDNFTVWEKLDAGKTYNATIWRNGKEMNISIVKGLYVWKVEKNSPADGVLPEKSIIYAVNSVKIGSLEEFLKIMNSTYAGEKINISFYYNENFSTVSLILGDKYDFIKKEEYKGKGFIGVNVIDLQNVAIYAKDFVKIYNPRKTNILFYLALPFRGYSPPPSGLAEILTAPSSFWMIYNIFYWIFWLNFALGTFNALPAIPLDGGYLFKDGVSYILEKLSRKMKKEKLEKVSSAVATIFSVFVLICIFSIILIPKLRLLISF